MSGHSKWATIKRKKAAKDSKRSNQFASSFGPSRSRRKKVEATPPRT